MRNTPVRELRRSWTVLTPRLGEGSVCPDGATKLRAALAIAGEGALPLIGESLNKLVFLGGLAEPSTPYWGGVRFRRKGASGSKPVRFTIARGDQKGRSWPRNRRIGRISVKDAYFWNAPC